MKSITIHGIDEPVYELIKSRARENGQSINRTIKKILEEALGVRPRDREGNRGVFEEFLGIWSEQERAEFEERTADLRAIDEEDWR